ncbi:MAG TPA: DUF2461 domain-containing protein [Pseudonocardiaceae bacterium]|nr:DUF2461 domain-containing protein [Pseudonocardiaceae bacterium]
MAARKFTGFGEHAIDFYDGLVADNSKAYWTDNREVYESDVRAPMQALLDDMAGEFGEFGSAKIFRPYRDVRFAKDKTPYKTHCGAVIESGRGAGAFYVQLGPDGLLTAGGSFFMSGDQVRRFRESAADDLRGIGLTKLLATLRKQGWEIRGERLKTVPRGYDSDHPRIELLRHKSLYASTSYEPDDALHGEETAARVRARWRQVRLLNEWAADHVGVAEEQSRR